MNNGTGRLKEQTVHLVAKARKGDAEAIEALYRLCERRLLRYVRKTRGRKLSARVETQDFVQSVWTDVLGNMEGFEYRGPESFFRWMRKRVEWKVQDVGRFWAARRRDMERDVRMPGNDTQTPGAPPPVAPGPTPSVAAMANENLARLNSLLAVLSDDQRKVVILRIRGNESFEEIGKTIGRSAGAARQLYNRGLKKINDAVMGVAD
jgi:RNA polymerase sigma-70 factor, ECF subfamily